MTCKECYHFEVCDSGRHIGEHIEDDGVYTDCVEKECCAFRRAADVVEVEKGKALLPITKEELAHLMNDTIAYIWRLEDRNCAKEEFGYFTRKKLLEKLKRFEKEHFPEMDTCGCNSERSENGKS